MIPKINIIIPNINTTIALEDGFTLNVTNLHMATEYSRGIYWNENNPGQWWIENLTPNAEYQYVLYSCQIKTDHHYSVDVEVTGTYTNQHTYTQSTTTFPVAKDVMEADSNGKIYFSLPNAGLYGAGLSWIRISS